MDYAVIPWHAIPLTILGLHLFYSCINQAMVQRGFGGKTEWDVRMAILMAGFCVILRPFVEIFPGMIARALAVFDPAFRLGDQPVDNVFPMLISNLVPAGFQGLIIVGILSSVMSTIAAFLNSISTLFTYDVYRKWFRKEASDKELVRVGTIATFVLMIFAVLYSPVIGHFGGIFNYFQQMASYLAVPIATVFLFGMFWKRATSAAALTVIVTGIPIGVIIHRGIIPGLFSQSVLDRYSLGNFFVVSGITQAVLAVLMIVVSLYTRPKPQHEIASLLWTKDKLFLPPGEPKRPFFKSVGFWWALFVLLYIGLYIYLW